MHVCPCLQGAGLNTSAASALDPAQQLQQAQRESAQQQQARTNSAAATSTGKPCVSATRLVMHLVQLPVACVKLHEISGTIWSLAVVGLCFNSRRLCTPVAVPHIPPQTQKHTLHNGLCIRNSVESILERAAGKLVLGTPHSPHFVDCLVAQTTCMLQEVTHWSCWDLHCGVWVKFITMRPTGQTWHAL